MIFPRYKPPYTLSDAAYDAVMVSVAILGGLLGYLLMVSQHWVMGGVLAFVCIIFIKLMIYKIFWVVWSRMHPIEKKSS